MVGVEDIPVVAFAFFRVREDGIGFAYLGEAFARLGVVAVAVWVGFFGENVELFLEFRGRGVMVDAEDFVVVGRRGGRLAQRRLREVSRVAATEAGTWERVAAFREQQGGSRNSRCAGLVIKEDGGLARGEAESQEGRETRRAREHPSYL
jgi:hypothetical protein